MGLWSHCSTAVKIYRTVIGDSKCYYYLYNIFWFDVQLFVPGVHFLKQYSIMVLSIFFIKILVE